MKKLVMCGNHIGAIPVIKSLLESGYKFSYFVCISPNQNKKYTISGYYDYTPLAEKYSIPVYYPEKYSLEGDKDRNFFEKQKFDLIIQGGWQRLFPESILLNLSIGAIGIHGSPDFLPKGRGRSPMNWALIAGKKRFIMHLFLIKTGVDNGDIFDTEMFDITDFDDIETLYFKYSMVYERMIIRSLPLLMNDKIKFYPQTGTPTYFPKRAPEDGLIDWEKMDVWEIYDFVRAQTKPYPGAFGYLNGKKYRIWKCRVFDTRLTYEAGYGECVKRFGNKLIINCLGGLLLIDVWEQEVSDQESKL